MIAPTALTDTDKVGIAAAFGLSKLMEHFGETKDEIAARVFPGGFTDLMFSTQDPWNCVLARCFGTFNEGSMHLGWMPYEDDGRARAAAHGFEIGDDSTWDYEQLDEAWERLLMPHEFLTDDHNNED